MDCLTLSKFIVCGTERVYTYVRDKIEQNLQNSFLEEKETENSLISGDK